MSTAEVFEIKPSQNLGIPVIMGEVPDIGAMHNLRLMQNRGIEINNLIDIASQCRRKGIVQITAHYGVGDWGAVVGSILYKNIGEDVCRREIPARSMRNNFRRAVDVLFRLPHGLTNFGEPHQKPEGEVHVTLDTTIPTITITFEYTRQNPREITTHTYNLFELRLHAVQLKYAIDHRLSPI